MSYQNFDYYEWTNSSLYNVTFLASPSLETDFSDTNSPSTRPYMQLIPFYDIPTSTTIPNSFSVYGTSSIADIPNGFSVYDTSPKTNILSSYSVYDTSPITYTPSSFCTEYYDTSSIANIPNTIPSSLLTVYGTSHINTIPSSLSPDAIKYSTEILQNASSTSPSTIESTTTSPSMTLPEDCKVALKSLNDSSTTTQNKRSICAVDEDPQLVADELAVRRAKNSTAARRCRLKKKIKMDSLERQVMELRTENNDLQTRTAVLESQKKGLEEKNSEKEARVKMLERQLAEAHEKLIKRI